MKHTPGPWRLETPMNDDEPWVVAGPEATYAWKCIASIMTTDAEDDIRISAQEASANARLIAAAPDLFEALLDILPFAQHELAHIIPHGDKQEVQRRVVNALEAIAKAKA